MSIHLDQTRQFNALEAGRGADLLLVEDDLEIGESLATTLRQRGHRVELAVDGHQGLVNALTRDYHLILLDKLLPKLDGFELLKRLRQSKDTPVIMLTACGDENQRIAGFMEGADDYLPKPFNLTELMLRIDALLRRSKPSASIKQETHSLSDGELQLNTKTRSASWQGQELNLTPIEYHLLEVLMNQRHEVLSKQFLYQEVLNKPYGRYDRSLDMHISNLRGKLSALMSDTKRIRTVHGKGYRYQ